MGSTSSEFGHRRYGDRQVEVARPRSSYSSNPSYYLPPSPTHRRRSPEYTMPRGGGGRGGGGSLWCFGDPEMKRRKRVASYKMYSVEGKFKSSFKRGIKWIKAKCSELVHGH